MRSFVGVRGLGTSIWLKKWPDLHLAHSGMSPNRAPPRGGGEVLSVSL